MKLEKRIVEVVKSRGVSEERSKREVKYRVRLKDGDSNRGQRRIFIKVGV